MEQHERLNNISEKYRDELEQRVMDLDGDKEVIYRFLNPLPNPDPETRVEKPLLWPESRSFRLRDRIIDPYSKKPVEIGVLNDFEPTDDKGNPITGVFIVRTNESKGTFRIHGTNAEQKKFYMFFEACNYNASNPNRDKNVEPIFERLDFEKEAEERSKSDDLLSDMLVLAKQLSPRERREIAISRGWDKNEKDAVILDRLRQEIKANPKSFQKLVDNRGDLEKRALINEAKAEGVISYLPIEHKWVNVALNETIVTFNRDDKREPVEQFLDWVKSHKDGQTVLKNIKKQMPVQA